MRDGETGAARGAEVQPCPPGFCDDPQVRAYANEVCKQQGWPPGHKVLFYRDGQLCYCDCGGGTGAAAGAEPGVQLSPCSAELCRELRPYIERVCHDQGWPPDHPVLVANPDGGYCYCTCGQG